MRTATKVFAVAAVLGAIGGSVFLSSRPATANGFAGPFAGGTQGGGGVSADDDITPNSVVAQAASGQRAFGVAHDGARIFFGESGNVYCYNNAGAVTCASAWSIPSIETNTIGAATGGRDRVEIFYPQPYPLNSLSTCDGTHMGVLKTLSTDGRTYACDGTTNQRLGYSLSNSASLNFPSLNNNDDGTLTMTVTGAVSGDAVVCNPTSAIETGLQVSYAYVSASNTVTVVIHDASGGTVDPAAATYKCVVLR